MKNKKGVTLAELCVAIAILAIVVTMTLTFTQLNREHMRKAEQLDELMTNFTEYDQEVSIWLRTYDSADYYIKLLEPTDSTSSKFSKIAFFNKKDDTMASSMSFVDGRLECTGMTSYTLDTVKSIVFSMLQSDYTGKVLIKSHVEFYNKLSEQDESIDYTYSLFACSTADYTNPEVTINSDKRIFN